MARENNAAVFAIDFGLMNISSNALQNRMMLKSLWRAEWAILIWRFLLRCGLSRWIIRKYSYGWLSLIFQTNWIRSRNIISRCSMKWLYRRNWTMCIIRPQSLDDRQMRLYYKRGSLWLWRCIYGNQICQKVQKKVVFLENKSLLFNRKVGK